MLDEAAGRDDQAALKIAADQQLLDQQPRHDRLAGAGIVGEQEPQRLARQHLAINGRDLMRQRLDLGRADGEVGIEQVGKADAVGLGREPQQRAVGVECIRAAGFDEFERGFLAAIDEPLADTAVRPGKPGSAHRRRSVATWTTSAMLVASKPRSRHPGLMSSKPSMSKGSPRTGGSIRN